LNLFLLLDDYDSVGTEINYFMYTYLISYYTKAIILFKKTIKSLSGVNIHMESKRFCDARHINNEMRDTPGYQVSVH